MADVRWIAMRKIAFAGTLLPDAMTVTIMAATIVTIMLAMIATIMVAGLRTTDETIRDRSATIIAATATAIAPTNMETAIGVGIATMRSTAMTRRGDTTHMSLVVQTIATTITDNPHLAEA